MLTTVTKILRKDVVKVFSLNAVSTLVRMLTGFVSVKVVAVLIGPAGVALLGQLNNFSSILLTISSGGINNGVTKYVAQYKESVDKVVVFLRTAIWITTIFSLVSGLVLIIGSGYLSVLLLKNIGYYPVFIVFGCTIIFYSLNALLLSTLNGFKEYKKYVAVNITSSITGLLFSASLTFFFGVFGALLSAVTFQSIIFFVTLYFLRSSSWFKKDHFVGKFNKAAGIKLAHYSLMAFVSAASVPVSQLIIRSSLVESTSLAEAGLWEGMNRISGMYLMVITTSLSIYYLPRLSEIDNLKELKREILSTYKIFVPPLIIVSLSLFIFRGYVIQLLFNKQFEGMKDLFCFQLIGDFFKVCSWILAYQMIAKSMTKAFILTEVFFSLALLALSISFLHLYGIVGATIGYAFTYILYFLVMIFLFRKTMFLQ